MNEKKICSIVVTYNRKEDLEENINSLLMQSVAMDILIVDNNSNDGTEKVVKKIQEEHSNIIYIKLNENLGGSGGFYTGLKKTFDLNYDFFILMDDDGKALNNNTIKELVKIYDNEEYEYTIVNSIVYGNYEKKELAFGLTKGNSLDELKDFIKDGKIEDTINPFNGTLIPRKVIEKIGFPMKDFFVSGDEEEYSLRAKKNGCKLITAVNSEYYHPTPIAYKKKFLGKEILCRKHKLWRVYYCARNYMYINKVYKTNRFYGLKSIARAFIISDKPFLRVKYTILGLIDGYREKFVNDKHVQKKFQEIC